MAEKGLAQDSAPSGIRPLAIGIFCVYAVLVLLFHDFLQPLTILTALPLALDPLAAASMSLELTQSGVESMGQSLRKLGARILAQYQRQLNDLLCGDGKDDVADRDALRDALNLSETALTGTLSVALIPYQPPSRRLRHPRGALQSVGRAAGDRSKTEPCLISLCACIMRINRGKSCKLKLPPESVLT